MVTIAFSGGVDSLLLLHASVEALGPRNVEAVIGVSPTLPKRELEEARRLAAELGVTLREPDTGIMDHGFFTSNPPDRCYHCRVNLGSILKDGGERDGEKERAEGDGEKERAEGNGERGKSGRETGSPPHHPGDHRTPEVLDGANADDPDDYRPGLRAASEAGIGHPLVGVGITKADVRTLLRELGYPETVWSKPAAPCLSSRIPYGQRITPEKLTRIEEAEEILRELGLGGSGSGGVRVRYLETVMGDVALVELPDDLWEKGTRREGREELTGRLRRIGFARVLLDMEGFRSGKLNDVLGEGIRRYGGSAKLGAKEEGGWLQGVIGGGSETGEEVDRADHGAKHAPGVDGGFGEKGTRDNGTGNIGRMEERSEHPAPGTGWRGGTAGAHPAPGSGNGNAPTREPGGAGRRGSPDPGIRGER